MYARLRKPGKSPIPVTIREKVKVLPKGSRAEKVPETRQIQRGVT